ncbi:MAG TPA: ABC transporter ATP-binding protein [Acidobacteriota bacterium]|nr:ABC transporter ATP-binding protein [Acidobacteriota bacterium]
MRRLRRAFGLVRPQYKLLTVISILTLLTAGINAIEPLVLMWMFDSFTGKEAVRILLTGIFFILVIGLIREIAAASANWLTWRSRLEIHHSLLEITVGKLHTMPLDVQRSDGVGAILTKLDRSIQGYLNTLGQIISNILPAFLYVTVSMIIMIRLEWRLAVLVLLFSPLPLTVSALATPEQTRRESILLNRWSRIYSRFNEVLSGIVTVRSFAMEDVEKARFLDDVRQANNLVIRGVFFDSTYSAAGNVSVMAARVAAIALGGYFVIKGNISVDALVAFLGYVSGVFGPVQGLGTIYQTIHKASVSVQEIFTILDREDHLADSSDAKDLSTVRGAIQFENVHFKYPLAQRAILNGVTLEIVAGETVAVVGPSGAGKTTMMALLQRFYDPVEGNILLDGENLKKIKQKSLRSNIGIVLQDPLLFNDSIRNNIAYGKPNASKQEIVAAAKAANAHEFIGRLPEGYETLVGERGGRLSKRRTAKNYNRTSLNHESCNRNS